jgi:hypothetical protein
MTGISLRVEWRAVLCQIPARGASYDFCTTVSSVIRIATWALIILKYCSITTTDSCHHGTGRHQILDGNNFQVCVLANMSKKVSWAGNEQRLGRELCLTKQICSESYTWPGTYWHIVWDGRDREMPGIATVFAGCRLDLVRVQKQLAWAYITHRHM